MATSMQHWTPLRGSAALGSQSVRIGQPPGMQRSSDVRLATLSGKVISADMSYCFSRNTMLERLGHLDRRLSTNEKAAWLAAQLGMELPTTSSRHAHFAQDNMEKLYTPSPRKWDACSTLLVLCMQAILANLLLQGVLCRWSADCWGATVLGDMVPASRHRAYAGRVLWNSDCRTGPSCLTVCLQSLSVHFALLSQIPVSWIWLQLITCSATHTLP